MEPVDNVLPVDDKHFYLFERSVVDVMIKQGWTLEKPYSGEDKELHSGQLASAGGDSEGAFKGNRALVGKQIQIQLWPRECHP